MSRLLLFCLLALPAAGRAACLPHSPSDCPTVTVGDSAVALSFDGAAGGLAQTGFTMALPRSNFVHPATISVPGVPGYEPAFVSLANGELVLTATRGSVTQTALVNASNNSQVNALGVGLRRAAPFVVSTTLVEPAFPDANGGEHAGLYFGLGEDDYVRLVVANRTGSGNASIELRREVAGATSGASSDVRIVPISSANTATVQIDLLLDPLNARVSGRFASSAGQLGTLGPLDLPPSFFAGTVLPDGATGPVSFAGVLSTMRFNPGAPIAFRFAGFSVDHPPGPPVAVADAATVREGGTTTTLTGGSPSVLANDASNSIVIAAELLAGPAHGSVSLAPDGTFSYVHDGSETTTDSFTYRADDGLLASAPATVTITIEPMCDAIAFGTCDTVPRALPLTLDFGGPAGGLAGTGFTMVLPHGVDRYPATPSIPELRAFEPSLVALDGERLRVTATRGAMTQTQADNVANNTQVNALGVGIVAGIDAPFLVAADVVAPPFPDTSAGEHAGLWFGLGEDDYVRLVVTNRTGAGLGSIELRREIGGVSSASAPDTQLADVSNLGGATVRLQLLLDPIARTAHGRWRTDDGQQGSLGPLALPASFFAGFALPDGAPNVTAYAGIVASNRFNAGTPIAFRFDRFAIRAGSNEPPRAAADVVTVEEGAVATFAGSVLANDDDAENDAMTATLVDPPGHAAGLFQLRPDGTVQYQHDGSETTRDAFTYMAADAGGSSATATVTIEVSPVNDTPMLEVLHILVDYLTPAGTVVGQLSATDADPGDTLTFEFDASPASRFAVSPAGVITVVDRVGWTPGSQSLAVRVRDSAGASAAGVVWVRIGDDPRPPLIFVDGFE